MVGDLDDSVSFNTTAIVWWSLNKVSVQATLCLQGQLINVEGLRLGICAICIRSQYDVDRY
jgi:hypothetical protein